MVEKTTGNIIVRTWSTDTVPDGDNRISKLFVFRKEYQGLVIIDSTKRFELAGKGEHFWVSKDSITVDVAWHGGRSDEIYTFDEIKQKYLLVQRKSSEAIEGKLPDSPNASGVIGMKTETYNVIKQEMTTVITNDDDDKVISSKHSKNHFQKLYSGFVEGNRK